MLNNSNEKISDTFPLNNDEKFYSIQTTINSEKYDENKNYTITKILCKTYQNTDYCFTNGYVLDFPELGNVTFKGNVSYLLILKGNTYNLFDISTNDINEYARDYNDFKELQNGKVLDMIIYEEKNKVSSYIANYMNLVVFEIKESYNYLSNTEKAKNGSEYNYEKNIDKYLNLSSNIISYKKEDNTYIVTDSNNNTFKIIEETTMDYKIEL
jgi:hypothetical protein